ncbi:ribonuclease M5 [Staphylococcus canis]|uniref:Ribonuclease M5 n=1 Tax=Staphylococcus canis TaxID=2724942 RepID=A0ABS0TA02_9STAP|nr:ribonuclease M5 [Staphylococcus canis]
MEINEFVVVEGRDDTTRVKQAVSCETIETHGSAIDEAVIEVIRHAQATRGVIVFTDPDFPGDKIRTTIQQAVPGVKHAFIDRNQAKNKQGKIGVEHASLEAIREALRHVSTPLTHHEPKIDQSLLIDLGLIIGPHAKQRREILGRQLHIGHSNGKQLLKKLNAFGYTEADVRQALRKEESD